MAWSLGEDSATWEHVAAMKKGLEKSGDGGKGKGKGGGCSKSRARRSKERV